jgi:Ca2+-binding RTX toxin-like protein
LANAGTDTVTAAASVTFPSYTLPNHVENLIVSGTSDFNTMGNGLNNSLTGGAGNDTLDGAAGNDTLIGGAGNDTYIVDSATDVVTEAASAGNDTVRITVTASLNAYTLPANVEQLEFIGSIGSTGTGNLEANTLTGGSGNDTLSGGAGNDVLNGGQGNDTYVVDSTDDVVTEALNQGTDTVQSSVDYQLGDHIENLTLSGTAEAAVGNSLDNVLTGQASGNILVGGAGNDTLVGGEGADELYGQEGDDTLYAGAVAGAESPIDVLVGGAGNDTYYVGSRDDQVVEWASASEGTADTVISDSSTGYTLGANVENLTLLGNAPLGEGNGLANLIIGSAAGNMLIGLAGNDTLDGGAGTDILVGGADDDVFRISLGTGLDIILDFDDSGNDRLDLTAYSITTVASLNQALVGNDLRITLPDGNVVVLVGQATLLVNGDLVP